MRNPAVAVVVALSAVCGCTGQIEDPPRGTAGGAELTEGVFPGRELVPTPVRFWRLSFEQYDNAVSELAGRELRPSVELGFPAEVPGFAGWLHQARALEADGPLATSFESAALAHAPEIAAGLAPCAATDRACIDGVVSGFGSRAWRRPLTAEEAQRYGDLYAAVAAEDDPALAAELVVEAMLRSPFFLFRSETGDPSRVAGEELELTPHEIAEAMSFALWNRAPDAELRAAADRGALIEPAERVAQVRRLLGDARFLDVFYTFTSQWLGFHDVETARRDGATFPEFDAGSAAAMETETRAFLSAMVRDEDAKLSALFLADYTFPPAELSFIYGRPTSGARLDTPERMGILMQPSFLTAHAGPNGTSPTARGVFVVRRVGCFEPPRPDDDLVAMNPVPDPTLTTRQSFERHRADPGCASCHALFDPVGMAFESFDAVGRYRTTENGLPVDPSGEVAAGVLGPDTVHLSGTGDLARAIAESPAVHQCVARKAFQYFAGREERETDDPVLRAAMEAFVASDYDLRELIAALFEHPAFVLRRPTTS
jgi:hypothetical protein